MTQEIKNGPRPFTKIIGNALVEFRIRFVSTDGFSKEQDRIQIFPDESYWMTIFGQTAVNAVVDEGELKPFIELEEVDKYDRGYWADPDLLNGIKSVLVEHGIEEIYADDLYVPLSDFRCIEFRIIESNPKERAIETRKFANMLTYILSRKGKFKTIKFQWQKGEYKNTNNEFVPESNDVFEVDLFNLEMVEMFQHALMSIAYKSGNASLIYDKYYLKGNFKKKSEKVNILFDFTIAVLYNYLSSRFESKHMSKFHEVMVDLLNTVHFFDLYKKLKTSRKEVSSYSSTRNHQIDIIRQRINRIPKVTI